MARKMYKMLELVGSSPLSWEDAVTRVIDQASKSLTQLRVAEVRELDARIENGQVTEYRAKVVLSFKYEVEPETL
ncbi:MAG: dodecin domain-containing protein [Methanosarcinales archaeon]|nr:dodecin domain-containing protein [Methanosarcinales archaeon]